MLHKFDEMCSKITLCVMDVNARKKDEIATKAYKQFRALQDKVRAAILNDRKKKRDVICWLTCQMAKARANSDDASDRGDQYIGAWAEDYQEIIKKLES